ncbi:MAG TPA: addiction module protein [Thermodesulfovibrionia bacterium]|nr:addiction module protein [Thermodesulfovibrionia bacterium]
MEKTALFQEIRKLNIIDRLNIVTDIWEDIKDSDELVTISDSEKELLKKRLEKYLANPDSSVDWDDLKDEKVS